MADLGGSFDASNVPTLGEYTPVPAGSYRAAIIRSEFKDTKNGQGKYLELVFEILEGPSANRLLSSRLNLINPNAQAVENRSQRAELHLPRYGQAEGSRQC